MSENGALLSVRDVTVRFDTDDGAVHAVDRVSFDLARGEVLAIVGESGCGKSVTTMSLLGLLPPTASVEGSARFNGDVVRKSLASDSITPQDVAGDWTPSPRNDSTASPMIAAGIVTVACTIKVESMFGKMCFARIRASLAPFAIAART